MGGPDPALEAILAMHDVAETDFLGSGGEASVYALDHERVLRVFHPGAPVEIVFDRSELVDELAAGNEAGFALSTTDEIGSWEGRCYAVEARLAGTTVLELLGTLEHPARPSLVADLVRTAAAIGSLPFADRPFFGELLGSDPVRAASWPAFLHARAARSLAIAGADFAAIDAAALAAALPDTRQCRFVHLDLCASNLLADGPSITAVLDIGGCCLAGDPRLDPVSAAVYLGSPEITPTARPDDLTVARQTLADLGLAELYEPARRWLAAFWSFAIDDVGLHRWCRRVLLGE